MTLGMTQQYLTVENISNECFLRRIISRRIQAFRDAETDACNKSVASKQPRRRTQQSHTLNNPSSRSWNWLFLRLSFRILNK